MFLDEIANLPYHLQAKLLTVIQKRYFIKVGSNTPQPTNIRLICATNRNLDEMVHNGEFREDLLYRINTIHLHIPALRERKEDILPLAQRFLEQYNQQYLRTLTGFSADAEQRLLNYPWHGNIRELQHTIEKAVILSDGNLLKAENLQLAEVSGQMLRPHTKKVKKTLRCKPWTRWRRISSRKPSNNAMVICHVQRHNWALRGRHFTTR